MTTDQSIISLFFNASFLVKLVMLGLLAASIVSWALIFQRWQVFQKAKKVNSEFEQSFWSGIDLNKLYQKLAAHRGEESGAESIFLAGFKEYVRLRKQSTPPEAIVEGAERAMYVAMSREIDRLETYLPFLATAGSASPYIGLFGTVWGIMNTFRALGAVQHATLQMVAPGISEALVATAMGLFVAIPAMIAYNRYSNRLQSLSNSYANFLEEFTNILHRQAHSQNGIETAATATIATAPKATEHSLMNTRASQAHRSQHSSHHHSHSPKDISDVSLYE